MHAPSHRQTTRLWRTLSITCATIAALMIAAWIAGAVRVRAINLGRISLSTTGQCLELTLANAPVTRTPTAWYLPTMPGQVLVASQSSWHPSAQSATMTVGPAGVNPTIFLRVIFVPTWLPIVLLIVAGGGTARLGRTAYAKGHCARCGYDLRTIPADPCPECGTPFVRRLFTLLARTPAAPTIWTARATTDSRSAPSA